MNTTRSSELFAEANKHTPGGVNSPVRAFKSVGGDPIYIKSARGPLMTDVDGNEYIDYVGSWGPMILGHAHERVIEAIRETASSGTSFGTNNELEIELAVMIKKFVPSVEMVRMVNSGTEATMSAMRLARAFTGRTKIIKFEGCYHGHGDSFLSKAGSGVVTLGLPDSPGVTPATAADTLNARFNDIASVEELVESHREHVAAIFIEPVAGNMGCVAGDKEFLASLREMCTREGIVLIFDEVMTGFRLGRGGAQELYGISPDLTTFGKIIGGGLPVGAYGGRADIMRMIAPAGPVYQAGTLSGNPLAMAAGLATLRTIDEDENFYTDLEKRSSEFAAALRSITAKHGLNYTVNQVGSMLTMFFTDQPVTDFDSAKHSDAKRFGTFHRSMLERGIYLPPSQFEAWFISSAHRSDQLETTIESVESAISTL